MFFDDRFDDYKVSLKHKWIRLAFFIFFALLAIGAITAGVLGLSKKQSGFYAINASVDSEAVNYSKYTELHYYMEGKTSEIKDMTREVTMVYSRSLLHIFKLLDKDNIYTGYENIASINERQGEFVNVSNELYEILKDAYEKTYEQQGFNMFAGLLYEHWGNILILYDYEEFDPLVNTEEREIIAEISELVNNLDNFKLEFRDEDKAVRLSVSSEYINFCNEKELSAKVLDLNLLKEAYIVEYVTNALEDAGYKKGYMTTTLGITATLSELEGCQYPIYALDKDEIVIKEIIDAVPGSVISSFNHFPKKDTDILYQVIDIDGQKKYRSPYSNLNSDGFNNLFVSANTIVYSFNPVEANYSNIKLINAKTKEEYENTLDTQREKNQSGETKTKIVVY